VTSRTAIGLLAASLAGCLPGPGAIVLAPAAGRVSDRDTQAPIAGAQVIEWWRGAGRGGGPQPTYHARFATSDAEGRFAFPRALAPSPRMWLLRTYPPTFGFYHPRYGLVRGGEAPEGGEVALAGSLAEAELRLADLAPVCAPEPKERWQRELARSACPTHAPRRPDTAPAD
jgi:hypothetical protein